MFKCFCCSAQYEAADSQPKFCNECGSSMQLSSADIDKADSLLNYKSLLADSYFDLTSSHDDNDFLKYRVRLKISYETHQSILRKYQNQRKTLESLSKVKVEFDQNVAEAFAGNDTYLKFRFTNNSNEMLRVKFFSG